VSRVKAGYDTKGKVLYVDLHGLNLSAAMELASRYLASDTDSLTIITGKGLHSPEGKPVIKPSLERYLSRNGYWWHHQEISICESKMGNKAKMTLNTGAIVIDRM
jgi:DNA-nicking Smr family endonuclease